MSNLAYNQFDFSVIKKKVTLYAVVDVGGSGAVTLKQWTPSVGASAGTYSSAQTTAANAYSPAGTQGIASVTKETAAGQWTFTFQGSFARLLGARATCLVPTTGISAAPDLGVVGVTPGVASAPGSVTIALSLNGAAANPASGERVIVEFVLDDSSTI